MEKEERKQKIEELSKKMKEVNSKIKEGTDTVIVAGMEAKDVLDEKMKDAQSGLEAAKEQCRIATEKGKSKISSELLKAQMNFKVAKENMQERKEARDKEKLSNMMGKICDVIDIDEIINNLLEKTNGNITIIKDKDNVNLILSVNQRLVSEYDIISEKEENRNIKIKYRRSIY